MFSNSKASPSVIELIRSEHAQLMEIFHQYTAGARPAVRKALAETICDAIDIHAAIEEEVFYPVLRRLTGDEPVLQKSEPEHDEMRRMIAELRASTTIDERYDLLLNELMRDLMHHVADEETVLLPEAERLMDTARLAELAAAMTQRRLELLKPKSGKVGIAGSKTALVVGLASAVMAASLVNKKVPKLSQQH